MNTSKGDMFPNCKTLNIIRGKCQYGCKYCYMKFGQMAKLREYQKAYHISQRAMSERIPNTKKLMFIGSTIDMWAPEAEDMVWHVLDRICEEEVSDEITWLFQSKNPKGYEECLHYMPKRAILGITLETSSDYGYKHVSNAPPPVQRAADAAALSGYMMRRGFPQKIMINIEPAMHWNLDEFLQMLLAIRPTFISIGAETKGYFKKEHIPQPTAIEAWELMHECAHREIGHQLYIKRNIYLLSPTQHRKEHILKNRELISHHGVIVQGDPTCQNQEFFSTETMWSTSAPQEYQETLPGILPGGSNSSYTKTHL